MPWVTRIACVGRAGRRAPRPRKTVPLKVVDRARVDRDHAARCRRRSDVPVRLPSSVIGDGLFARSRPKRADSRSPCVDQIRRTASPCSVTSGCRLRPFRGGEHQRVHSTVHTARCGSRCLTVGKIIPIRRARRRRARPPAAASVRPSPRARRLRRSDRAARRDEEARVEASRLDPRRRDPAREENATAMHRRAHRSGSKIWAKVNSPSSSRNAAPRSAASGSIGRSAKSSPLSSTTRVLRVITKAGSTFPAEPCQRRASGRGAVLVIDGPAGEHVDVAQPGRLGMPADQVDLQALGRRRAVTSTVAASAHRHQRGNRRRSGSALLCSPCVPICSSSPGVVLALAATTFAGAQTPAATTGPRSSFRRCRPKHPGRRSDPNGDRRSRSSCSKQQAHSQREQRVRLRKRTFAATTCRSRREPSVPFDPPPTGTAHQPARGDPRGRREGERQRRRSARRLAGGEHDHRPAVAR